MKFREPSDDAFVKAMTAEDALSVAVRAHLYIEHELTAFLDTMCKDASQLDRFGFSQKVQVALALGLPEAFGKPLRAAAKIRNEFAHNLEHEISPTDAAKLLAAFDHDGQKIILESYAFMRSRSDPADHPERFADDTPLNQIVVCLSCLRSGIIAANPAYVIPDED